MREVVNMQIEKSISSDIRKGVARLGTVSGHGAVAMASVLGFSSVPVESSVNGLKQEELKKTLPDGSSLLVVNPLTIGLIKSLPVGSIVGIGRGDVGKIAESYVAHDVETLGIIRKQNELGPVLYTICKKPEGEAKGRGIWKQLDLGDVVIPEKDVAINALQNQFSILPGTAEPEKLITDAVNLISTPVTEKASNRIHDTHESQTSAQATVNTSFIMGSYKIIDENLQLHGQAEGWWVRVIVNADGTVKPIADNTSIEQAQKDILMTYALRTASIKVASGVNPKSLGGGTEDLEVFKAVVDSLPQIAEVAGNGGTITQTQNVIRQNLGVNEIKD